jgi:hypothetical protein
VVEPIEFATHTDLASGLQQLVLSIQERTKLRVPIKMYIAGGMAFHLYTAGRVTTDVDAEFSKKFFYHQILSSKPMPATCYTSTQITTAHLR